MDIFAFKTIFSNFKNNFFKTNKSGFCKLKKQDDAMASVFASVLNNLALYRCRSSALHVPSSLKLNSNQKISGHSVSNCRFYQNFFVTVVFPLRDFTYETYFTRYKLINNQFSL